MKGHIRHRPGKHNKNTHQIIIELGADGKGVRKKHTVTVHGTIRAAEAEKARLIHEFSTGQLLDTPRLTVAQYLERWLSDYAATNVTAKTLQGYRMIVRDHLTPRLGHHQLTKLQPLQIQGYYGELARTGRLNGKGGLAANTILQHHRVFREALQQAVKWGLLHRNPADATEPPKRTKYRAQVLTEEQTVTLLQAVRETWLYVPLVLSVATMDRRGEIMALQWPDVRLWREGDHWRGQVTVTQATEVLPGEVRLKAPKSENSAHTIPLPWWAAQVLAEHREAWEKQRAQQVEAGIWRGGTRLFVGEYGKPRHPDHLSSRFYHLIRKLDLPTIRLHDLRHGHVSHLIERGEHMKVISERAGHHGIGITMDMYGHLSPKMQEGANTKVEAMYGGAFGERKGALIVAQKGVRCQTAVKVRKRKRGNL